jgi:uncharacterized protein (TIRG00374 family)
VSVNDVPRPTHVEEPFSTAPWKRYARSGALVLITGASLYLLLPSLLAVFGSWRSLGGLTWYWAALALACEAGSFVLLWELDRIALRVKNWFVVASSQLAGNAVGKIVPGGGATATAFSVALLRRAGVDAGNAAVALAASTSLQVGTALALPVLALPAIVGGAAIDRGLATSAYLGALVLAILAAASVIVFAFDEPLESAGRRLQWLLNRTVRRRRNLHGVPKQLLAERDFVRATIGHRWKAAVLSAAGSTAFDFLALLCALRALGAQPRPSLVIIAYAGAKLLVFVPFTPGGLGFVEAGLVGTLTLAGVSAQDALLATLTYRLVSYWIPIPAGGAAYIMYRRRYLDEPPRNAEFPHGVSTISDSSSALEDESRSHHTDLEVTDGNDR